MAGTKYEEVHFAKKSQRSICCLKFWLSFFVIVTLTLVGVLLWAFLAPRNSSNANTHASARMFMTGGLHSSSGGSQLDICSLPSTAGPCQGAITRFYYDTTSRTCKSFLYGGCLGNSNNFLSMQQCNEVCIPPAERPKPAFCMLKSDQGPCSTSLTRYAFDKKTDSCVEFTFGGCGGNLNNFANAEECERTCKYPTGFFVEEPLDTSLCHLPLIQGNCRASIERWGFDGTLGGCKKFIYGGCGANENNFESMEACKERCRAAIPMPLSEIAVGTFNVLDPVCNLPHHTGPCRASIPRWAFNGSSRSCIEFVYGGCQGNGNNFQSREACEARCSVSATMSKVKPNACNLPKQEGPCRGDITRYYYDSTTRACAQFSYGGCRGNENNFPTLEECSKMCADA